MKKNKMHDYTVYIIGGIVFFLIYIIQYSDIWNKDRMGFPQLMLSASILCGMFWGEKVGAIFGFFIGSFLDAVAFDSICFNTIFMLLCGYISGILVEKFVNNNFRASLLLSFAWTLIYYFCRWCSLGLKLSLLETSLIHSAFLTILYFIPMYGFMFILNRKNNKHEK